MLIFILLFGSTVFAKDETFLLQISQCRDQNCKIIVTKSVQYNFKELLDPHAKTPPPGLGEEIAIDKDTQFIHFGYLQPKKVGYRKTILIKTVKLQIRNGTKVLDSKKVDLSEKNADTDLAAGATRYQIKIERK